MFAFQFPARYKISVLTQTSTPFLAAFLVAVFGASFHPAGADLKHSPLVPSPGNGPGFTLMDPTQTGVRWTNSLPPEKYSERQNLMNGAGVALGDYDNDGFCDIFLCNKFGPSALYRNLGNFRFEEVTAKAGVECRDLIGTGAVFADINADQKLDLLVTSFLGPNACFLNLGQGRFTNVIESSGLKSRGGSTSQALSDIDSDGDLDLYVNYFGIEAILRDGATFSTRTVGGQPVITGRFAKRLRVIQGKLVEFGEPDILYLNSKGTFQAIQWEKNFFDAEGRPAPATNDFGLAVQIRDINDDGNPDIYVCNDFQTPDRIWLGRGNGQFQAVPPFTTRNMSFASMGVDFADIDRDGRMDFITVEMLSRDFKRHLRQSSPKSPELRQPGEIDPIEGVPRNALYWNRGDGTYAEIAWFSGVAASDWSWTPIFLDVDLDGFEDLLISNGHVHDVNDRDSAASRPSSASMSQAERRSNLMNYPRLDSPNVVFRNRRDLTFEDMSTTWQFNSRQITHGMAVADLDNDGDLDVVGNCANATPLIYRNNAQGPRIAVRLKGPALNFQGIGARVSLVSSNLTQTQEILSGGRYLSGDDPVRVFAAVGSGPFSVRVRWREGQETIVKDAVPNSIYEIAHDAAASKAPPSAPSAPSLTLFDDKSASLGHRHVEQPYEDFQRQPLLPRRLSQLGPGLAWFDWNADGADDLLIGAARANTISLLQNDGTGNFKPAEVFPHKLPDDTSGLIALTLNGKATLLAGLARYERSQPEGELALALQAGAQTPLPLGAGRQSTGPLACADVDGDGDLDIFIGGRLLPGRYPEAAPSALMLMENGQFQLSTTNNFQQLGLVTAAQFSDLDSDGFPELILACEWGPILIYRNKHGHFQEANAEFGLESESGLWNSILTADLNADGRLDLVAGNLGLNTFYNRAPSGPWFLYHGDFAGNGEVALLEAFYNPQTGTSQPWRDLKSISGSLPWVSAAFASNQDYSSASVQQIFGSNFPKARELRVTTLKSTIFWNRGDKFETEPLPAEAQWAPVFGLVSADFTGDGLEDLFLAQNFFASRPEDDRLDAGRSMLLAGTKSGKLHLMPGQESGLFIYGEQRGAAASDFDRDGRVDLAVSQNGAQTKLYRNRLAKPGVRVSLKGPAGNPSAIGAQVRWINSGPLREVRAGSGYWSQDSSTLVFERSDQPRELMVQWPGGKETVSIVPPSGNEVQVNMDGSVQVTR